MKSFASDLEREKRELQDKARAERLERAARKESMNGGAVPSKFRKTEAGGRVGGDGRDAKGVRMEEKGTEPAGNELATEDDEYLLEDDDDEGVALRRRLAGYLDNASSSDDDDDVLLSDAEGADMGSAARPQVFFVSRTHSQLMQFVGELKKTRFHPGMSLVSLASRKQLCINPDVLKLGSSAMINERCMDLQNDKVRKDASVEGGEGDKGRRKVKKCRCPFLKRNTKGEQVMKDMMLSEALDIEDLASLGRKRGVCPYYAARDAAKEADIVLAPYSSVIMADTRASLGIDVGESVVIVDEAHNLVDAINGGHSCVLSEEDVGRATEQIEYYFQRFKTRLSARNAKTVQTLLLAAKAISAKGFGASVKDGPGGVMTTNKFLFDTSLDNVNMFQLGRDMSENKLIFKIGGYWKNRRSEVVAGTAPGGSGSLQALIEFLKKLTYDNKDGRIIVDTRDRSVKYVMLNASTGFRQIVDQARSVVLASGTLSPLETILPLFDAKPPEAIERYRCDHIVDPSRLLAMAVPSGPSGKAFDFRHPNRSDPALIADLGRALVNVCNVTPGGVVVFFSSFNYCEEVMRAWGRGGGTTGAGGGGHGGSGGDGVLERLKRTKDVYVEPRSATDVERVLAMYAASIEKGKRPDVRPSGAVIFAVVGGKLAEGINFGDDMGRLVVMVGLPYPNPQDPELRERMRFMDRQAAEADPPRPSPSKDYYVNLCMKAVNQCVGRAIRHINDYAAILLLDGRYVEQTAVSSRLSNWIGKSLRRGRNFGECQGSLVRFFKSIPSSP